MRSDRLAWPLFLLLLMVLAPSVGVVWMMREAVRNERLATGQRLRDAYQTQLESAKASLQDRWSAQLQQARQQLETESPTAAFGQIAAAGVFDGLLICDRQARVAYPDQPAPPGQTQADAGAEWTNARRLEFAERQPAAAAEAYAQIALAAASDAERARARQARVRCLIALGRQDEAIDVLHALFNQQGVRDAQGRSLSAAAGLRLLELRDPDSPAWSEVADRLVRRVTDYRDDPLVATQRRFLMTELGRWPTLQDRLPTLAAETLAAEAAASYRPGFASRSLGRTPLPGVWAQASMDGRLVGLFRTETLRNKLQEMAAAAPLPSGVAITASLPEENAAHVVDAALGEGLAPWRLGLAVTDGDPFEASSRERRAVHIWIAALVVAVTLALAWLLIAALRQQLRLAQLKNDLVATVSHELKTPLASIRLLVDTLLDSDERSSNGQPHDPTRDYLELIAQENARLTRLIDNFLTFSRLERGKQRFESQPVEVRTVVRQAAAVFQEHVGDASAFLRVDEGPPALVNGDADALVSAIVNLLENAWKYSGEQKHIELSSTASEGQVVITVRDNGVGLTPHAARRVFDRFYQVDQRVARSHGGCGLGLSIVQSIAKAHGGRAAVESRPGAGSAFMLRLPRLTAIAGESQPNEQASQL